MDNIQKCDKSGEIDVIEKTLDLIYRQKAEIDGQDVEIMRLKHEIEKLQAERQQYIQPFLQKAKSEAIKEFAERLKENVKTQNSMDFEDIDNLAKEMTEGVR